MKQRKQPPSGFWWESPTNQLSVFVCLKRSLFQCYSWEFLYHCQCIGGFSGIILEGIILPPSVFYHCSKISCHYNCHYFLSTLSLQLHLKFSLCILEFSVLNHLTHHLYYPFIFSKFWSLCILGTLFYLSSNFLILFSVISNLLLYLSTELLILVIFFNLCKFYLILFKTSWSLILLPLVPNWYFDSNIYYFENITHLFYILYQINSLLSVFEIHFCCLFSLCTFPFQCYTHVLKTLSMRMI